MESTSLRILGPLGLASLLSLLCPPPASHASSQVVAWGYYYDMTMGNEHHIPMPVPAGLTDAVAIAGGGFCALALKANGTVIAWAYGPTNVPPGLTNVVAIAAGDRFNLALKRDGTVSAWGVDYRGETIVPAGLTNGIAVAAGDIHGLVLKADGTVVAWGGQTNIPAGLVNVVAIAAGGFHNLALTVEGQVIAWGSNSSGQAKVPWGLADVVGIAAGEQHSLALRSDGTVAAWGDNTYGQTNVPTDLANVVAIAAGSYHSLAVTADGTVVAWGAGTSIANASEIGSLEWGQSLVPAGLRNATAIAGGSTFSLVLVGGAGSPVLTAPLVNQTTGAGGVVYFRVASRGARPLNYQWSHDGAILPGATNAVLTLSDVQFDQAGMYSVTVSNSFGATSTSAFLAVEPLVIKSQPQSQLTFIGATVAFGASVVGRAPLSFQWQFNGADLPGATNSALVLSNAQLNHQGVYSVVVSNALGMLRSADAELRLTQVVAWGRDDARPAGVLVGLTNVVAIAAGSAHSLALKADSTVVSWGDNGSGETNVPFGLTNVIAVAAGYAHSLALRSDGTVVGWGHSYFGQTRAPPDLTNAVAIAAGYYHSLALKADGTVVAWGYSDAGQTNVPPDLEHVVAIAGGGNTSVALKADGTVVVWGASFYGQTIVPASVTNIVAVAVGGQADATHVLALKADGTLVSWGLEAPVDLTSVVAVAGGGLYDLVLKADGALAGWSAYSNLSATNPPADVKGVVEIAAGNSHGLALVGNDALKLKGPSVWPAWNTNGFSVSLPTQSGRVYRLEYKNSLADADWTALPLVAGNGGTRTLTDPSATGAHRFYRVRQW